MNEERELRNKIVDELMMYDSLSLKEAVSVVRSNYNNSYLPFSFVSRAFMDAGLPPLNSDDGEVFFEGHRGKGIKFSEYWEAIREYGIAEMARREGH